jgi:hypothetical protein
MEESIYNIIPKEYVPPAKESLYKSKFPPGIRPTGSTFCNHTTSKPLVKSLRYRLLILEENITLDYSLIPSMVTPRLLDTWKAIETLSLIIF